MRDYAKQKQGKKKAQQNPTTVWSPKHQERCWLWK